MLLHTDCTCISVGKGMRWEPDAPIVECITIDKFNKEMKHLSELGMVKFIQSFVDMGSVRLNLFNHLLALFCAKFACNLAIRHPVFRWELCKGSV